jgi:hypothetical protein
MMRRLVRIPVTLLLIALAGVTLFSVISIATLLYAVKVFTQETKIAEVVMYPIQRDEKGEYITIEFTPLALQDALSATFNPQSNSTSFGTTQTYKVYGDTVAIRGPFLKLHDGLLLLSYDNIYKLALIEGEYRRNNNPQKLEGSEFTLNGGFDDGVWFVNNDEGRFPYNLVVDRLTISGDEEPGFTGSGRKRYELVVTRDTITWNLVATFSN